VRVVVAGSGIAGAIAALRAVEEGMEVTLVHHSQGASHRSLGVVDVLGYLREEVSCPAEGVEWICRHRKEHPYAITGADVLEEALEFFRRMAERAGMRFMGTLEENIHVATQFGTFKPTCMALEQVYTARIEVWDGITVGIDGEPQRDYNPAFIAESLDSLLREALDVHPERVVRGEGELTLKPLSQGGEMALPLLGDGRGVVEALLRVASEGGAEVRRDRIAGGSFRGGRLEELRGAGGSYKADAFVLATGDWIGGGMRGLGNLLGLDMGGSMQVRRIPLPEEGHPYALSGVRVDGSLRPLRHGEAVENLRVAGALLCGYDYCTEKSGWGVGIATGYLAGGME